MPETMQALDRDARNDEAACAVEEVGADAAGMLYWLMGQPGAADWTRRDQPAQDEAAVEGWIEAEELPPLRLDRVMMRAMVLQAMWGNELALVGADDDAQHGDIERGQG